MNVFSMNGYLAQSVSVDHVLNGNTIRVLNGYTVRVVIGYTVQVMLKYEEVSKLVCWSQENQ